MQMDILFNLPTFWIHIIFITNFQFDSMKPISGWYISFYKWLPHANRQDIIDMLVVISYCNTWDGVVVFNSRLAVKHQLKIFLWWVQVFKFNKVSLPLQGCPPAALKFFVYPGCLFEILHYSGQRALNNFNF